MTSAPRQLLLPIARRRLAVLLEEWQAFDAAHPEVFKLFVRFTFDRIDQGFAHFSADAILHKIRWETATPKGIESTPKINNSYAALWARKFMHLYPAHAGFFRTRRQTSRDRMAS